MNVDQDIQKQFAALIFKVKPDTYVLVFRGTDDSIVGWKEDFHMTYMAQIPAQKMAARYLQKALENLPWQLYPNRSFQRRKPGFLCSQSDGSVAPRPY